MPTRRYLLHYALAAGGMTVLGCGKGRPPDDATRVNEGGNDVAGHLNVGAVIFPEMDQIDFTGPFEALPRLPDSTFHVLWKEEKPFRDLKGLILTP